MNPTELSPVNYRNTLFPITGGEIEYIVVIRKEVERGLRVTLTKIT